MVGFFPPTPFLFSPAENVPVTPFDDCKDSEKCSCHDDRDLRSLAITKHPLPRASFFFYGLLGFWVQAPQFMGNTPLRRLKRGVS